jgi:hypothetical protein
VVPTFPGRLQPSIIGAVSLTAVFGMGTGVSLQLYPPEIFNFRLPEKYFKIFSCEEIFANELHHSVTKFLKT